MITQKRRIKIFFLIDWLYVFGGTERHLHQLLRGLSREKFDLYLLALNSTPEFLANFRLPGVTVLDGSLSKIFSARALALALRLRRFFRSEKIDIVQTFGMGADNFGSAVAKLAGVPVVISSRRDLGTYRNGKYELADRLTRRWINHYLSVCDSVSETIRRSGVAAEKITRIYNGLDFSHRPSRVVDPGEIRLGLGLKLRDFVIGTVAHFRKEKGHGVFFEAIRQVAVEIPHLRVFALGGPGDALASCRQRVADDPVLRRIVTIDHVENVRDYLAIFDLACLTPVSNEGFSNALLEQMAAGNAVIATDVGGNAEAIVHGHSGIIIPAGQVAPLAEAILKLYRNSELRGRLGQNARQRVRAHFSLEKMIENYETFYLSVMNRRPPHKR